MDPHITAALPAPKTPQENARRIARDRMLQGNKHSGNARGADPTVARPAGNPGFKRSARV